MNSNCLLTYCLSLTLSCSACSASLKPKASSTPSQIPGLNFGRNDYETLLGTRLPPSEPREYPKHSPDSLQRIAEGVSSPDALNCDFQRPQDCCWDNVAGWFETGIPIRLVGLCVGSSGLHMPTCPETPSDELDFVTMVRGSGSSRTWRKRFGGAPPGKANRFLAVAATGFSSARAIFRSCPIGCRTEGVEVSLRHWRTDTAELELCSESPEGRIKEGSCLSLKRNPNQGRGSPTPTKFLLPGDHHRHRLLFRASKFFASGGDMVILDDIRVHFQCLKDKEPRILPSRDDSGEDYYHIAEDGTSEIEGEEDSSIDPSTSDFQSACSALQCDMRYDMCGWKSGSDSSLKDLRTAANSFRQRTGRYKNAVTGISGGPRRGLGREDGYAVTYLTGRRRRAGLESPWFRLPEPAKLELWLYRASEGVSVKACPHPQFAPCQYLLYADDPVDVNRRWHRKIVSLPRKATKILIWVESVERNTGAVGLGRFELLRDHATNSTKLCNDPRLHFISP